MPYLKVNTNMSVSSEDAAQLLTGLSQLMATEIGKPESYVMVELESGKAMSFAGSTETLAYLECKSIGLPVEKTKPLSAALCQKLQESLSIPAARVYIEFADAKAAYWGWNNSTFG